MTAELLQVVEVTIIYGFVATFGAAVGSFLNVVVYRLPAGMSLVQPPSRCPHCGHGLAAWDNVPVLGWLWLRGRCRYCQTAIAARYPLVEAVTAGLFMAAFWRFGWSWETMGYWGLLSGLLALALIDWDTMLLPDALTQPLLVAGIGFRAIAGWLATGTLAGSAATTLDGLLGMVLAIWLLEIVALVATLLLQKLAMGGGDAKLMAAIGAWLGWKLMLLSWFLGNVLGALAGGLALTTGKLQRGQAMPFGPYLAMGAAIALFCGEAIIAAYWQLFAI